MNDRLMLYDLLFENARATSLLILDKNGVVMDVNIAFQKTFGYSREDIVGENFSILFIKEDREKNMPETELKNAIRTGSALDNNYVVHKNGSKIWVHGESIFSQGAEGAEFFVKIIQDISGQKNLEEALKLKNEDLKKLILDKDNFVYTASHDLQSPINNIEGLVKQLEIGSTEVEDSQSIIQLVYKSIGKFKKTIKDLAIIGKLQEEEKIMVEEVNFQLLTDEVLFDLHQEVMISGAKFKMDFADAPKITFSRKNLRSILHNLVSNALKYRSPERVLEVKVSSEIIDGSYILLQVQDNGLGIKEDDMEKVFEMYTRLHNHVDGSGVGISIAKRIIENAGGKIKLDSELDKGTNFKVFLPI